MKRIRYIFIFILLLCVTTIYAQPGQPETSSFTPIGQTDLVNLSTGDFTYNIPLMEVGGYPINIAYQSGITMEQEASMVGLGWNINIGAITRSMRGLPDDFKGDLITTTTTFKNNWTVGVNLGSDLEIFNLPGIGFNPPDPNNPGKTLKTKDPNKSIGLSLGVYYNSYTGYGFEWVFSPSISANNKVSTRKYDLGISVGKNSDDIAATLEPNISVVKYNDDSEKTLNIGTKINSVSGLKGFSFSSAKNFNDKLTSELDRSSGTSVLINNQSYRPSIPYAFNTSSFTYNAKLGLESFGVFSNIKTSVYRSSSKLRNSVTNVRSFGYLYLDESTLYDIIDVNREKDMGYVKESPNLSVPALMNDVFFVNGHGVSGTFRAFRNDVGILFEPAKSEYSGEGNLGTDFGMGFVADWKIGVKPSFNIQNTFSKKWSQNFVASNFDFKSNQNNSYYESVYFKNIGEKTIMSNQLSDELGGYNAIKVDLTKLKHSSGTMSWKELNQDITKSKFNVTHNSERAKREQVFSYLTAKEASINKSTNNLEYVSEGYFLNNIDIINEPRINNQRKDHHISHCEVINNDGMRYIYSLPVYNNVYEEVSFSVCDEDLDGNGLVSYDTIENSLDNKSGLDHFYEKKNIPPYAHSYLLTSVVTNDYVDVLDDGISNDDLGNFVKFNYFKASNDYKWRFPYEMNQANFNGGFDSKVNDNQGNYLYGEKELVYIQSIESKTQVAIFKYENRYDAHEVKGEDGGQGSESMKNLVQISLYAKKDLIQNLENAIPLKTVYFNYDYSLLYGHPSHDDDIDYADYNKVNSDGKLTLKELYFTYKDNPKSKSEKYQFSYNNDYGYNRKNVDRWGVFKPNTSNPQDLNNTDFPYVIQQKAVNDHVKIDKDLYASQWNLNNIKTPSKGDIKIFYESDDYSFIQDKQAMVMTPLSGIDLIKENSLYDINKNPSSVLIFKVPKGADKANEYVQDSLLYLRAYVNLFKGFYEYVPCYLEVNQMELDKKNSDYDILKLTIKNSTTKDKSKGNPINAITKSSIQFAKLHMNDLLTKNINSKDCNKDSVSKNEDDLLKWSKDNIGLIGNYYSKRLEDKHAKFINLNKSYARLNNISHSKLGGGNRVHSIEIHDNWNELTDGSASSTFYATDYFYNTNHEDKLISSGVASYEPSIGNDENPFRKPVYYSSNTVLAPDDRYMIEEPVGEIHFPAATVVYSEVIQKVRRNSTDRKYATGKTVNSFYTAKDFPVKLSQTSLERKKTPAVSSLLQKSNNFFNPFLKFSVDNVRVSQGYSVIKNDMHGKPKSTFVYAEGQTMPISGVEYIYKTDDQNNLNNKFDIVKSDGTVVEKIIGVDYEMYVDMRGRSTVVQGLETSFDIDQTFFPVFTAIPTQVIEQTSFESSIFQKVIFQYGLLDSIKVFDNASEIITKNIALDAENSSVLISKTFNEFGDPIYNTSFPAHWAYPKTGGAYQNLGARLDVSTKSSGEIISNFPLQSGDELLIISNSPSGFTNKVWVYENQGKNYFIDASGNLVISLPSCVAKIIKSSYRNMSALSIAQFKTTDFPNITGNFSNNNILDASAIEYSDDWRFIRKTRCYPKIEDLVNPFQIGLRGNWRPKKSYLYLSNRISSHSIRTGGAYESFDSFWKFQLGSLVKSNSSDWKWTSESVEIHPNGSQLSSKDPLGRYNSVLLGYDNQLKIASVSNSKISNSLNLNFESIDLDSCESIIYKSLSLFIKNDISHTGNSSLMLDGINSNMRIQQSLNQISTIGSTIPPYKLQEKDLLPEFKPDTGNYLVSVWVREDHNDYVHQYSNATLDIETTTQDFSFLPEGPMVEGWQKIEGEFTISTNDLNIKIIFNKNQFSNQVFFDDFRIHPIDANMMTHVYDKEDFHLMAELDENNYAVFYEYDEEGKLIRTKRETEKGIMTIEEKRGHIHQKEKNKKVLHD